MSTNKTQHYQLNQWEAEDKVLRTEFNEDNQRLEDALTNLAEGLAGKAETAAMFQEIAALKTRLEAAEWATLYVPIMELSVEKRSPKVNIDLTGLDLNQYRRLDIYASLNVASPGERIALRCNGMENVYRWSGIDNQWMDALCNFTMIPVGSYGSSLVSLYLAPGMIGATGRGWCWGNNRYSDSQWTPGGVQLDPSDLHTLNLVGWGRGGGAPDILTGGHIVLYGLKR